MTEWVERDWAESRPRRLGPAPDTGLGVSQQRPLEQLALRRRRRRRTKSFSNDSWKEVESSPSSGVRDLRDL